MGIIVMKTGELDYADVQGLVRYGYGRMKKARYELLRVKDLAVARAWLRSANIAMLIAALRFSIPLTCW